MAKVKTCSAAKKRFSKAGGKRAFLKRSRAYKRHLLTKKGPKRRRQLRKQTSVSKGDRKNILKLLPY